MFISSKNSAISLMNARIKARLQARPVVFIGLMGAGKTTIGRYMAHSLDLPFCDADQEIEIAANMQIKDIFADYGEAEFRILEKKVITRILRECKGVIALGGGTFMTETTRALLKKQAVSIWLKADKDVLLERALRRKTRPLLQVENPHEILQKLIEKRYPFYALADITLHNHGKRREAVVRDCLNLLDHYLQTEAQKREL